VKRFSNILFVHQLAVEDTAAFERAAVLAIKPEGFVTPVTI
jgi:hypothetical protein